MGVMKISGFSKIVHQDICFKKSIDIKNDRIALKCKKNDLLEGQLDKVSEFDCKIIAADDILEIQAGDKNYNIPRKSSFKHTFHCENRNQIFTVSLDTSVSRDGHISYYGGLPEITIEGTM